MISSSRLCDHGREWPPTLDRLLSEEVVRHALGLCVAGTLFQHLRQVLQYKSMAGFWVLQRELLKIVANVPADIHEHRRRTVIDELIRREVGEPAIVRRGVVGHALIERCSFDRMLGVVVVERRAWRAVNGLKWSIRWVTGITVFCTLEVVGQTLAERIHDVVAVLTISSVDVLDQRLRTVIASSKSCPDRT